MGKLIFEEYERIVKPSYLREITQEDIDEFREFGVIYIDETKVHTVSISDADLESGSPKIGDMIAVNENATSDQWLVNKEYFHKNFCTVPSLDGDCVIVFKNY